MRPVRDPLLCSAVLMLFIHYGKQHSLSVLLYLRTCGRENKYTINILDSHI